MSHGAELPGLQTPLAQQLPAALRPLELFMRWMNTLLVGVSMLALIAACLVLTGSVFMRYFLKVPTDWQDEVSVFLLVGSVFFCAAYVQTQRGHIGIEALAEILPARVNRVRMLFNDVASFLFCAFFSWKSVLLLTEAIHEGHTTSSSWAPPLWIPYGLMTLGMVVLTLQLLLQIIARVAPPSAHSPAHSSPQP